MQREGFALGNRFRQTHHFPWCSVKLLHAHRQLSSVSASAGAQHQSVPFACNTSVMGHKAQALP